MANEAKRVLGTWTALEASGASIATGAFAQADDANIDVSSTLPLFVDLRISFAYSVAPVAGEVVNVYARPIDINSTNDAQVPSANYLGTYLGSFLCENVTSTQYAILTGIVLPAEKCALYLENKVATQTLSSGWTLDYRTHTIGPA